MELFLRDCLNCWKALFCSMNPAALEELSSFSSEAYCTPVFERSRTKYFELAVSFLLAPTFLLTKLPCMFDCTLKVFSDPINGRVLSLSGLAS